VAILAGNDVGESLKDKAFQYGKHLGIAFQLIDDLLDFISSTDLMGKLVAADLQLGLATAPVLFAAQKYPDELNPMIERRFGEKGDVKRALELVHQSDGLSETKLLAEKYCEEAIRCAGGFRESPFQAELVALTQKVINRAFAYSPH
jgi:geranylgeranyl pyrophosphate synthase